MSQDTRTMFKTATRCGVHLSHCAGGWGRGLQREDAVHLEKRIQQQKLAIPCSARSWLLRARLCSGLKRKPDQGHIPGHPKEEETRGKMWQQSLRPPLPFQLSLSVSGQLPREQRKPSQPGAQQSTSPQLPHCAPRNMDFSFSPHCLPCS